MVGTLLFALLTATILALPHPRAAIYLVDALIFVLIIVSCSNTFLRCESASRTTGPMATGSAPILITVGIIIHAITAIQRDAVVSH